RRDRTPLRRSPCAARPSTEAIARSRARTRGTGSAARPVKAGGREASYFPRARRPSWSGGSSRRRRRVSPGRSAEPCGGGRFVGLLPVGGPPGSGGGLLLHGRFPSRGGLLLHGRCPSRGGLLLHGRWPSRGGLLLHGRWPSRGGLLLHGRCPSRGGLSLHGRCPSRGGLLLQGRCPSRGGLSLQGR